MNNSSPQKPQSEQPLIRLESVKKVFLADEMETHALADITISIKRGEYVSIAGPSGCGKSTLLSILGLLDTPTEGGYWLGGRPVATLSHAERARIRNREVGFVFQSFNLIGDLTVFENVELPLNYRGITKDERRRLVEAFQLGELLKRRGGITKDERRRLVEGALLRVEMGHRSKHYPSQLSGGQQQRVAVARAIAGKPSILLADEPTGNLDSKNGEAVMQLLDSLHREGATICMVTHDPRFSRHARRTVQLFDGRIVDEAAEGAPPVS